MHRFTPLFLLLPACATPDDPVNPAACADGPRTFAIESIELPRDAEGNLAGLDLDEDGAIDNAGGRLLDSLFHVYADEHAADAWSAQLAARALPWILDAPCGGPIELRDGAPLGALADLQGGAPDGWHPVDHFTADVAIDGTSLEGTIGFGFAPPYREVIGASFVGWLNALLDAGDTHWGASLDADGDGTITYAELEADELFAWFMRPDLGESISFGIAIRAEAVTIE